MGNNDFLIASCERKSLSKGNRIYNLIFGLIVVILGMNHYQMQWLPLIALGILSIIYSLVGKELFKTKNSITITQSEILIKRSFEQNVTIDLKNIKRVSLDLYELQVDFSDYVKTYNLSWLSGDEHQKLQEKLNGINK